MERKFTHARMFALALVSVFLLSSFIGATVWAKPPQPPPPKQYLFYIWIGGNEIVLDHPNYLTVETDVSSGGWYYPYERRTQYGSWSADLQLTSSDIPDHLDKCGVYIVNLQQPSGTVSGTIYACTFGIRHEWQRGLFKIDRWVISIYGAWNKDYNTPWGVSDFHYLRVQTNSDFYPDGTYDPTNEVWKVNFYGASWELYGYHECDDGWCQNSLPDGTGTIINGFTVTIDKEPF